MATHILEAKKRPQIQEGTSGLLCAPQRREGTLELLGVMDSGLSPAAELLQRTGWRLLEKREALEQNGKSAAWERNSPEGWAKRFH